MAVTYLDVEPHALPARMPSPFGAPHALAVRAAQLVRAEVGALGLERDGKMFGVLVVRDGARVGFLRAFSGMIGGQWQLPGFAPPVFDRAARDAFWIAGERELDALADELAQLDTRIDPARGAVAEHDARADALRATHRERRDHRHALRATTADRHALDQQSRHDGAERRALAAAREPLVASLAELERMRRGLVDDRAARSREMLRRIFATYRLANARGEVRALTELFAPAEPPGGAGDCAAPKLLAHAYALGLAPIALAEFWIGAPAGGRRDGDFYPPCRGKCGPVLGHMLAGLDVDDAPRFASDPEAALEHVYEDAWLVVVAKPAGLLSVPGKAGRDSVLVRLRGQHPALTLVHRLDLDTSGLLVAAKDPHTHTALQAQFARREVDKRYVAWLAGEVASDGGVVDLPLRVDLEDRPRQLVDPVHGKPAVTHWQVMTRDVGRTRVALVPKTGRAHQLRVHAACGIGVPIVGDRLYGCAADRLMLHAEAIAFVHPHTHTRLALTHVTPF